MKNIVRYIAILWASLLILGGCSSSDGADGDDPKGGITLQETPKEFVTAGGEQVLSFVSSAPWTAVADHSWVSLSPKSGVAGVAHITVKVAENTTYDERNAKITLRSGSGEPVFVTVISKQKDAVLLTSERQEVKTSGGEIQVEVKANIEFTCEVEQAAEEWIKPVMNRGLTSHMLTFKVEENTTEIEREGHIIVKSTLKDEVVTVYQSGKEAGNLVLTTKKADLTYEAQDFTIQLQSNTDYRMELPQVDWLSEKASRAMSTYTHHLSVTENKVEKSRTATINFYYSSKGKEVKESVVVTQGAFQSSLVLSDKEFNLDAKEQTIDITLKSNVDYKMLPFEVDWLSEVTSRATTTHVHHIKVAENTSTTDRSTKVKFSYKKEGKDVIEMVSIKQKATEGSSTMDQKLVVKHHQSTFTGPTFTGEGLAAYVIWEGTGMLEEYTNGSSHKFADSKSRTTSFLLGGVEKFEMKDIKGIEMVDVSEF